MASAKAHQQEPLLMYHFGIEFARLLLFSDERELVPPEQVKYDAIHRSLEPVTESKHNTVQKKQ